MKTFIASDITLRECIKSADFMLTFKEKLEIVKLLDKLHCKIIELPEITNFSTYTLFIKTVASLLQHSRICVPVGLEMSVIDNIGELLKNISCSSLKVNAPVSVVQMEYLCAKKPPVMLKMISEAVAQCKKYCEEVEFSAEDAFRADRAFLKDAISSAINAGATRINICDSEGTSLPSDVEDLIKFIKSDVKNINSVLLSVEIKNQFNMSTSCGIAAIVAGADSMKMSVENYGYPVFEDVVSFIRLKGDTLGISSSLKATESDRILQQIKGIIHPVKTEKPVIKNYAADKISLDNSDDFASVMSEVNNLGYELSPEDQSNVFEAFKRVVEKKDFVGKKELEAIIATSTLQVPETYSIDSYVVNCGNTFAATASINLTKGGKALNGISTGDGPIAAAFVAIDQIVGCHYELDDFQIRAVTEGHEAMGSAIVRLRSNDGKLYSGHGISTDIVGASIRAYVSALNKIAYEEG